MTETKQGGPEKAAVCAAGSENVPEVDRDPMTGINKDMPGTPEKAAGLNQDFGDRYCTSR